MIRHKRTMAAVVLVLAALTACQPVTTPTPPVAPSPNVSTAETEQERLMRLDKTAAEKAYLTATAEADRLARIGGATNPTKALTDNLGGSYLKFMMENDLGVLKKNGWRTDRAGIVSVTANRGWSPAELGLTACEDASQVRLLDKAGKEVNKDRPRQFVQTLTASKIKGRWKITNAESKVVKTFDREGCEL